MDCGGMEVDAHCTPIPIAKVITATQNFVANDDQGFLSLKALSISTPLKTMALPFLDDDNRVQEELESPRLHASCVSKNLTRDSLVL